MSRNKNRRHQRFQGRQESPSPPEAEPPVPAAQAQTEQDMIMQQKIMSLSAQLFIKNVDLDETAEDQDLCVEKSVEAALIFMREVYGVDAKRVSKKKIEKDRSDRQASAPQPIKD